MRSVRESASEKTAGPARAAQYVRMSTEHQQYSTENQMDAMGRYAEGRKMQIVRTYSDEARSGLNIEGRNGLRDLIRDVERPPSQTSGIGLESSRRRSWRKQGAF